MINWIRKRLGHHVCEEFTKWAIREVECFRVPSSARETIAALNEPDGRIHYIRRFQERECTECGKLQQRELDA